MNERLTLQDLTDLLASKHGITKKDAEEFVKEFFLLIEEALENDKYLRIKGLGTFKLIDIDSRESINVNTGERFLIKGHSKVSFTPEPNLKDTINKPFSHFETVILNENVLLEEVPMEKIEEEETEEKIVQSEGEKIPEESIHVETTAHESTIKNPVIEEAMVEEPPVEEMVTETPIIKESIDVIVPKQETCHKKEKAFIPYLIATIIVVLFLCGVAILFLYYPDLLFSSSKSKTADMPVTTQVIQTNEQLPHTIEKKTAMQQESSKVAEETIQSQSHVKEEAKISSPVYSDSEQYEIAGTQTTHTIKKGESLTKVSLLFFGTKAMWPYIVKHNPEVIKNPNNVPFGTTINIPKLIKK